MPMTEEISKQVLTLPMYASLTKDEMNYVTSSVNDLNMFISICASLVRL